jgi:hypothetical protein
LFSSSQEYDPNNFDWGMNFGGGFKTDSGISLGVRYHGLGDLYDQGSHTTAFGNFQGLTCKSWRFMNKKTLSEYFEGFIFY